MFDTCEKVLGLLKETSYADVRIESYHNISITVVNEGIQRCITYNKKGAAIRLIKDGAWGFQSTTDLSKAGLENAAEQALSMAKAESIRGKEKVTLAPIKVCEDSVIPSVKIDFREIPLETIINLNLEWNKEINSDPRIRRTISEYSSIEAEKYFQSSEGTKIEFVRMVPHLRLTAFALGRTTIESYSEDLGGTGGHEILAGGDPVETARKLGKTTAEVASARPAQAMKNTHVVFDPGFMSLLSHEIVGHPSEADRVIGREAAWAGTAWWKEMEDQKIGSDYFTVYDDPTVPGTYGYYLYDDEGVQARRKTLVENGVLKERMHSRETAAIFNVEPNSGMRANTYEYFPIIRMSNTFWGTGDWKPEEIIEDTKEGILLIGSRSPSIDDARYQWAISAQAGWYIKNGELVERLKNCLVTATSPVFFRSIDALADDLEFGTSSCGKGDPMQIAAVGNGGPTMRGKATIVGG